MEMHGILSIAFSLGFLCSLTFVLFSCMSCRKFIAKRKLKRKEKKEKRINVPEIKIELENPEKEKQENGIPNQAYHETDGTDKCADPEDGQGKKGETSSVSPGDEETEVNGNVKQRSNSNGSLEIGTGFVNEAFEGKNVSDNQGAEEKVDEAKEEPIAVAQNQDVEGRPTQETVQENHTETAQQKSLEDEVLDAVQKVEVTKERPKRRHPVLSEAELEPYNDVVFQGEWRRPVALKHLLEIGLIDKETADAAKAEADKAKSKLDSEGSFEDEEIPEILREYLCGEEPVAGILVADSGEKKSIYRSAKDGILRRGTAISLLEAQAATGNIIDPVTGRKMSVKEAAQLGLLDKVYETVLLRAERAVTGYKFRASDHVLSLYEAMQKGLVVESHGLRLLEAQCATGGVIDHRINIRVPLDVAVERGLLDERLKEKLEDDEGDETKTFFDPNTEENVTYKELMKRSILDTDTGLRLYPLEKIIKKRMSYGSYSGRSSLASSRTVSRSNSRENLHELPASP